MNASSLDANEREEITRALLASKAWSHIIKPEVDCAIRECDRICLESGQTIEEIQKARSIKESMKSLLRRIEYTT